MDKIFIRNYILFLVIMLLCAGALCYGLISGDRQLQRTEDFLVQTQSVITETQQVAALIEGMIVLQRSFLLTNDPIFKDKYEYKKAQVSERIAYLNELTENNASQLSRLDEIRRYFTQFTTQIEERAHLYAKAPSPYGREFIDGLDQVDNLRDNIARLIDAMLAHEYDFFNKQIAFVSEKKDEYFNGLIIGVFTGTLFLLIFNAVLLRSQRRRTKIEASLKEAEERLALAIEGSRDGIFDWDIPAGKMFYSPRFFEMLGYERKAYKGTPQDFGDLLHPEDAERVWNHIEDYLRGDLAEYVQEFRMKHKSGRWVWIQARAKALYDRSGKAYRMVGAHADVTSMIQNQEKLENEKKLAEEANQAKSEFLAHMSHEIRTPLTAITGIAEIFEKNQSNLDEKQKRLVQTLGASASSLKDLINDILDFSKIESGELELVKEKFLLGELFHDVINMMSIRAVEKGISFIFDYQEVKDIEFCGDKNRLRQILVNLIGNGLKFTDEGGVTVQAERENKNDKTFLRVEVTDTGIGIAPENFDLVFERFKQADSSISRKYGGTGLGLPISRNLARLMEGDIFLTSQAGKGSTFTLSLPIPATERAKEKSGALNDVATLSDQVISSLKAETRILVVEDYEGNIVLLSYILDDMGVEYDIAKTGMEAVKLWTSNRYDVILMDIQMPDMDGFAATQKIRNREKQKKLPRTPIIGMTAHALVGDKNKCIRAGMDSYLSKPIVEADLKREILTHLTRARKAA